MAFNFCPNCGARLPLSDNAFAPQKCAQCGRTQYHNSKPCAGALIVKDKRVLLVLRAVEPFKGCWDIPGGFLEAGEHPRAGMLREVKEETGLDVRVIELLGVYMDQYAADGDDFFTLNHYYIVEPIGGTLRAADDVNAYRWFPIDAPPNENEIAFQHAKVVLRDLRNWHQIESKPALRVSRNDSRRFSTDGGVVQFGGKMCDNVATLLIGVADETPTETNPRGTQSQVIGRSRGSD